MCDAVVRALHCTSVMKAIGALVALLLAGCTQAEDGEPLEPPPEQEQPSTPPTTPPSSETPSEAAQRVLGEFSDCMTFADFQTANMVAWASVAATNNQRCVNCHVSGAEGFIASNQAQFMFDAIKQNKYLLLQFVTPDLTNGTTAAKMIVNQQSFQAVALGNAPHAEHPRFNPTTNAGISALQSFYTLTMQRIATECAPPPPT